MLGVGDYQFVVADRGGVTRLGVIDGTIRMRMNRIRDDMSTCDLTIAAPSPECCAFMADVRTVRNELVVYRDNVRVWEGPITRLAYFQDRIELDARDIMWYLGRRALEDGFDFTGKSVDAVDLMAKIVGDHFPVASDPFNIGKYVSVIHSTDDAKTAAKYQAYSRTLFELIDKYAEDGGIDYVVNGRRLIIHDTHCRAHVLPRMTEADFDGEIGVVEYGSELKTRAVGTNGEGFYHASVAPAEFINYYGVIDKVTTNEAEGDEDATVLTEALKSQADRELAAGFPAPVEVHVPDNTRIDPCCLINYQDFVPGAWVPVEVRLVCRPLTQWQRIAAVNTIYDERGETVRLSLQQPPAKWVDPL